MLIGLICFGIIFYIGTVLFKKLHPQYEYKAIQQTHVDTIPRIGGILILTCLIFGYFYKSFFDFPIILILCCIPILYFGIKEDIYHTVGPKIRFIALTLSAFLLLYSFNIDIYSISISFMQPILNIEPLCFIFFSLALVGLANGCNMIDGVNGLSSFYFLISFFSFNAVNQLLLTPSLFNPNYLHEFITLSLIIFIIFNYPLGKIFLGDHGNYFLALVLGLITINFYSVNTNLSPWGAILLLFYPTAEAIFTIFRRVFIDKQSILNPDKEHLHSKLFLYLIKSNFSIAHSNNLVLPILIIFWLIPGILFYNFYNDPIKIHQSLVVLIILYIISYIFISKLNNIKQDESYKNISK